MTPTNVAVNTGDNYCQAATVPRPALMLACRTQRPERTISCRVTLLHLRGTVHALRSRRRSVHASARFSEVGDPGGCNRHLAVSARCSRAGGCEAGGRQAGTPAILKALHGGGASSPARERRCGSTCRPHLPAQASDHELPAGTVLLHLGGEYPCLQPWDPGEYDEHELDRLKDTRHPADPGVRRMERFAADARGDKYTALNPAGFRRFIDMVHRRGMKMLTYASTCFLQRTDPDFRQEWSREGDNLVVGY